MPSDNLGPKTVKIRALEGLEYIYHAQAKLLYVQYLLYMHDQ